MAGEGKTMANGLGRMATRTYPVPDLGSVVTVTTLPWIFCKYSFLLGISVGYNLEQRQQTEVEAGESFSGANVSVFQYLHTD